MSAVITSASAVWAYLLALLQSAERREISEAAMRGGHRPRVALLSDIECRAWGETACRSRGPN